MVMRWIANPCYSGSIPLPLYRSCERDGMVDMSDLGSGDVLVVWVQVPPLVDLFILVGAYID